MIILEKLQLNRIIFVPFIITCQCNLMALYKLNIPWKKNPAVCIDYEQLTVMSNFSTNVRECLQRVCTTQNEKSFNLGSANYTKCKSVPNTDIPLKLKKKSFKTTPPSLNSLLKKSKNNDIMILLSRGIFFFPKMSNPK